jgi:alpha-L-rhamnosidase
MMRETLFTRRVMLKSGLAAAASCSLPMVTFLPTEEALAEEGQNSNLQSHMIWSADSPPVPVTLDGLSTDTRLLNDPQRVSETFDRHTVFLKQIVLKEIPAIAVIRLFAYTRYRLYVNGVYQDRGPNRFQNQRPEYDTRDITTALKTGSNILMVLVHRDAPTGRSMGHASGFAARIELGHGQDEQIFVTDASWLSRPDMSFGVRKEAWSSIEENIDARRGIDFVNADIKAVAWKSSIFVGGPTFFPVWPRSIPLQMEKRRTWVKGHPALLRAGDAATFELPEIIQGYHLLRMDAESGSVVEAMYGLPEDHQNGVSRYIAREGEQEWMGGDTFAMEQLTVRVTTGKIRIIEAGAVEVRYPFECVAKFDSSDPFLNHLWNICARSLEVLSENAYVDCADRERVEWTDNTPPAFDCTRVMMRGPRTQTDEYWGDNRLLRALLRRISLTQQPDGQVKAHSCSERWDIHAVMEDRSCNWVVLLRQYFESSNDHDFVVEMWPTLTRLMQWFLVRRTARGLVLAREWEVWDNPLRYQVCEGTGLNAFVYRALVDASYLGDVIGKHGESRAFAENAARLRSDFNTLLWNREKSAYDGALFGPGSKKNPQMGDENPEQVYVDDRYPPTAQAALFALYCGIVPQDRISALQTWLLRHQDQVVSPMSHYYFFCALYEMQTPEYDSAVLQQMRTAWKSQVASPWQTSWEDLEDHGGSKIHTYGMVPGYFLTAYVLGARRVGPAANRSILLEPRCGDLERATGIAMTEFGPIAISWSNAPDGRFTLDCSLPTNTRSQLRLYTAGKRSELFVDGKRRQLRVEGRFLEVDLSPGSHHISYF